MLCGQPLLKVESEDTATECQDRDRNCYKDGRHERLLDGEASPVTDHWLNVTLPRYLRSHFGERCLIPAFWLLGRTAGIPQRRRPLPRSAKSAQHRLLPSGLRK